MDGIKTVWRVALGDPNAGGIVLLDWGDYVASEPQIAPRSQLQEAHGMRAPYAAFYPRGNASFELSFTKIILCSSDVAARALVFTHLAAIAPFLAGRASLDCTIYLDQSNQASSATISGAAVQPGYPKCRTENFRFIADYLIVGAPLNAASVTAGPQVNVLGTEQSGKVLTTESGQVIAL